MPEPSTTLRQAADVLERTAEKATPGRWQAGWVNEWKGRATVLVALDGIEVDDTVTGEIEGRNARYIALVDPTVGKALAAWLRKAAEIYQAEINEGMGVSLKRIAPALAVAHAILREEADHA